MSSQGLIRRGHKLVAALLVTLLALAACSGTGQLGARPATDALGSVEAYLQRYQPGPLPRVFQTTRIYDRHGMPLAELWGEGRRTWVGLDHISPHLIDATIATEDATFYVNIGVDPARIAGAALQNAQQGQIVSGASTITMQLARNLFLGPDQRYDQDLDRKVLEAGLAQELNLLFSKSELLEMYLNLLNYGNLAYGPEAAARLYFGKAAADLSLAEASLIAGIPQRPADLDPFHKLEAVKRRQRIVLDLMTRHGYLSQAESDEIFQQPIQLSPPSSNAAQTAAPHFVHYLETLLDSRLGAGSTRRGGLQITTTLDFDMQQLAQDLVTTHVARLQPEHDLSNGALVALRPGTGEVLAMVGSADFHDDAIAGQVNVALSPRQPGSAIKPILYATAFHDNLISPATVLWDIPVTYTVNAGTVYTPTNYDLRYHGPVTVRTALANSYNVPAVILLHELTVQRMLEGAQSMGIQSLQRPSDWYGLSLTLGGGEVTLLDLTTAYATLANGGRSLPPVPVLSIVDGQGRNLPLFGADTGYQAISPAAAFLVTDILSDNQAREPAFGANSPLQLSRPAAVKTGTTSDWRDNWTVGYTPFLVTGVWAGNADGHPMRNSSGLTGAAPIWHDFMEHVLAEPFLLDSLGASGDPDVWQFTPPADVDAWTTAPRDYPALLRASCLARPGWLLPALPDHWPIAWPPCPRRRSTWTMARGRAGRPTASWSKAGGAPCSGCPVAWACPIPRRSPQSPANSPCRRPCTP